MERLKKLILHVLLLNVNYDDTKINKTLMIVYVLQGFSLKALPIPIEMLGGSIMP